MRKIIQRFINFFGFKVVKIKEKKYREFDQIIKKVLKKNNNIIFIRHSLAPGSGDPENINLKDCKTQRNLNSEGIKQSKKIGSFFKKNKMILIIKRIIFIYITSKFNSKNTIIEAYKSKNVLNGKVLYSDNNRIDTNNILKFY